MMDLKSFRREDPDANLLREIIDFAADCLMELEDGAITGAANDEKSPERPNRCGHALTHWSFALLSCEPSPHSQALSRHAAYVVGSSRTKRPSGAWSAQSCLTRTMNG
jgi:hypothetical protein